MLKVAILSLLASVEVGLAEPDNEESFSIRAFSIDLDAGIPRMLDLVRKNHIPDRSDYPILNIDAGLNIDVLASLQTQWLSSFNWSIEPGHMNGFNHFKVDIEDQTVHFIHEQSSDPDAIPLLLLNGWPGSFLEFVPLIRNLTAAASTSIGSAVSFHVFPSLPGFAFSSTPPFDRTTNDIARIYNKLMTSVLGYPRFAVNGTDWGAPTTYKLYDKYNQTQFEEARFVEWSTKGQGYFLMQSTKPNTIGLALQDSPLGQLAWMADQFISWSDPKAGTAPSILDHNEILESVSLYYLTGCFLPSVSMYYQNAAGLASQFHKATTDAPLLFSSFKYNPGFWPPELVTRVWDLVLYRNHEVGGHFPGLENPTALVDDLREIGVLWG